MHDILFYCDRKGREPAVEYMRELSANNTKDARIRLTKMRSYVKALADRGLPLTTELCKHIEGEIWELRPVKDRVLFASWVNGAFVLLHCFEKKSQKTPQREIDKAKAELADFKERWRNHEQD